MTAKQPVGSFESIAGVDYIRKIFAGKTNGGTKAYHFSASCPVTKANRYSVGIILFKSIDIFFVLHNIRTELFLVGGIQMRDGIQSRQEAEIDIAIEGWP